MSVIILTILGLIFGVVLGFIAIKFRLEGDPIVDSIDAVLPQTQCGQCGYPGCRPYAEAIATEEANINQCPPGGDSGVKALAELLGREVIPLNPDNGTADEGIAMVAVIQEETCIGCTKCIQVCPVDAISGSAKHMHTVLDVYCTGCELCLPPLCPVENCIVMQPVTTTITNWKWHNPEVRVGGVAA